MARRRAPRAAGSGRTARGGSTSRVAFAAAHVVADPRGDNVPGAPGRRRLGRHAGLPPRTCSRYGFGVAEAMDTAQRNMGLDWPAVQELVRRSAAQAARARRPDRLGRRHRPPPPSSTRCDDVREAYLEQVAFVESARLAGDPDGLAAPRRRWPRTADDYLDGLRRGARAGRASRCPALAGRGVRPAAARLLGQHRRGRPPPTTFLDLVRDHADKVDGVKVSLLSAEHEIGLRAALPGGRAALHRRRLQLPRADPGRRHPPLRRAARRLRRDRAGRRPRRWRRSTRATSRRTTRRWRRRCRSRATSSRRRPSTTRPGIAFLAWLSGHQPRLHHGRRPAVGPQRGAPGPALRAGRRRAAAARPRPGRATGCGVWLDGAGLTR